MEDFESLRLDAEQKLKIADHLLSTTYSLVKEPKLLVSVTENLFHALELTITGLLEYETHFKTLGNYGNTFEAKIDMFRRKIVPKYGISHEFMDFVIELKSTVDEHKKSSVEFAKKEKYIISDNDYNLRTLTADDVKKKVQKTKKYVEELFELTTKFKSR